MVAPLQIMTDATSPAVLGLAAGNFLEIIFSSPVNRAGVWLNPALGNVTLNALDASLSGIPGGSTTGNAGNFVGVSLPTDSIKIISIIATQASGFTIDDLTYGTAGGGPTAVPEPSTFIMLLSGMAGVMVSARLQAKYREKIAGGGNPYTNSTCDKEGRGSLPHQWAGRGDIDGRLSREPCVRKAEALMAENNECAVSQRYDASLCLRSRSGTAVPPSSIRRTVSVAL